MGTLVRVNVAQFINETHFRFHTENSAMIARYTAAALDIETLYAQYQTAIADEDDALEKIRKSAETSRIAEADADFDLTFAAVREYILVCLKHYDTAKREAAHNLEVVLHQYGNIAKKAYRPELAASVNLLQDLRARHDDVALLALEPWMQAHETAADRLAQLLDQRTLETSHQTDLRAADTRRTTDDVYLEILRRIEASTVLKGTDYVPGFVREYNAHATEYKNTLAVHLGRRKKEPHPQPLSSGKGE